MSHTHTHTHARESHALGALRQARLISRTWAHDGGAAGALLRGLHAPASKRAGGGALPPPPAGTRAQNDRVHALRAASDPSLPLSLTPSPVSFVVLSVVCLTGQAVRRARGPGMSWEIEQLLISEFSRGEEQGSSFHVMHSESRAHCLVSLLAALVFTSKTQSYSVESVLQSAVSLVSALIMCCKTCRLEL